MPQVVHEAQAIALTSTCLNLSYLSVAILIMAPASSESSKASAEQPASAQLPLCLMKCIDDFQEQKKTPKYKAAVEHSQKRAYRWRGR